ncbi:ZIP family metal transporter [Candidatus Parcubacteria bacterium]|nr:ZIP family metal transporter [Candidatus Parcubacteria bacterium]
MIIEPLLFSVVTFASTFLGGLFAIKFKSKIHYIMAFAAGVLLGIVAFDIFPEIIEQIKTYNFPTIWVMVALVSGFLVFHVLEKTILIHSHTDEHFPDHKHPHVGVASALALAGHSFMDGVAIGLGFQVNSMIGVLIAIAVISHDFTDGMNTVALMLNHKNTDKKAKLFLYVTALTPVLGVLSTLFFSVPEYFLFLYLGFFSVFLLYIGASDILPEAHSEHSSYKLIGLTVLGSLFIFIITRFM